MRKYLLPETGNFYKANLHCHTNLSDAALSPEEVKREYMERGYSIVAYTDHDILIPHPELSEDDFLPMVGFEAEINSTEVPEKTCHICFVGLRPDVKQVCWHREKYLFANAPKHKSEAVVDDTMPDFEREYTHECINEMIKRGVDGGFFVTYNHPTWSLEEAKDYMGLEGLSAMEIVNFSAICDGFDEHNPRVFDDMLRAGKKIFCSATDDNHNHVPKDSPLYDSFGAFNMIKAPSLTYENIANALINGDFYASEAPLIHELYADTNEDGKSITVHIRTSDVRAINLTTDKRINRQKIVKNGESPITEATFTLNNIKFFRITLTDACGNHAYTQSYYLADLLGQ